VQTNFWKKLPPTGEKRKIFLFNAYTLQKNAAATGGGSAHDPAAAARRGRQGRAPRPKRGARWGTFEKISRKNPNEGLTRATGFAIITYVAGRAGRSHTKDMRP
jgi:hypothetical protein